MTAFLDALNWFAIGAILGYFWHPIFDTIKKIYIEAQRARKDW
jgi:hypothetical protein